MTRTAVFLLLSFVLPVDAQVDEDRAERFFKEAQELCERDGGRLWGVSLGAPMVIADMRTQKLATSQPAPEGARPRVLGLVNAPIEWGGVTWGAYMWDDVVNRTPRERNELLLDESSPGWTRRVRATDDLATLVMRARTVQPASDATASAVRYGGAEIRASEQQREQQREKRLAELRQRFVDGPVLVFPGVGGAASDSWGAVVIPGVGTVYFHKFRSSGEWGTLEAEKGVLVASDGRTRRVPAPVRPDDGTVVGDGWTLKTGAGWLVREGTRGAI